MLFQFFVRTQEIFERTKTQNIAAVGLVALSRRLGCLDPNIRDDSEPMQLIHCANNIFEALNDTEISAGMWRFFPTASYRKLRANHQLFLQ